MFRTIAAAALLLAALAVTAGAQKDKDEKKAKLYKTPQEVFDAAEAAEAKKDSKTMAACLAPASQKEFAALLAVIAVEKRRAAKDEKDEKKREALAKEAKPANEILDKHGLTEKATKDVRFADTPKENKQVRKTLDELIKKPEAFLAEMLAVSDFLGGDKDKKSKLTDVKIDGDKATGTVVTEGKDKGKERKEPVGFVKINGGWRILLSSEGDGKESKDKDKDKAQK
jgi:hypothetical protein